MFYVKEHKKLRKQLVLEDHGGRGGAGGGGGGDTCWTIIDMPNITMFYGRPSWILAWE